MIERAARDCGPLLRDTFKTDVKTWTKDDSSNSPVTEIDLAIDAQLKSALLSARPSYGWLSEESADAPERLRRQRIFIVDPIDGTRAYVGGLPEFCVVIAVADGDTIVAGAIYNPITEEMFSAHQGGGAALNGAAIGVTGMGAIENSRMVGYPRFFTHPRWADNPWPAVQAEHRNALAYRLALVACGQFDGMIALGFKHEWDVAAGSLIVQEAGGLATDPWGEKLLFNQPDPRTPGMVAAGSNLHPLLIERVRITAHPGAPRRNEA